MNLRNHKTYIDELLERVQVDLLSPDEASTLLWAILDSFNRAYQVALDDHERRPPVPAEQVVWSASGEMIAPDGTRTPIKNVTLRMRLSDDGRPAAWSSDNITPPLFTQKIPAVGDHFKPDYRGCLVCGEPITWSKGGQKWRHFAHPPTQLHEAVAEGDLNQSTDISVPGVGDCQRYPTVSVSGDNTLYCYKCKGAATFQSVGPGISRWIHINPAQQKDHKVDLTGRSDLDNCTCIKCDLPIFYGAHPNGGVGWVHYGPTEPSHVAVEKIRTGPDPEAELVDIDSIPEDWDTEEQLTNGPWNDAEERAKPDTGNHDELVDVLQGEDPEENDNADLAKLDASNPIPSGAYTLWNSTTVDNAVAIHKSHKDGGLPERA